MFEGYIIAWATNNANVWYPRFEVTITVSDLLLDPRVQERGIICKSGTSEGTVDPSSSNIAINANAKCRRRVEWYGGESQPGLDATSSEFPGCLLQVCVPISRGIQVQKLPEWMEASTREESRERDDIGLPGIGGLLG